MKMFAKLIGLLTVLTLLVNCGGGGGASFTSGGGGGGTTSASVNNVLLLTSSSQLGSAGTSSVTLTAIVKDANNVVMENVPVTFSANEGGSLQILNGTTDASGTAQATLSTAGNKDVRTITVTATADSKTDTVDVDVTGTTISITGVTALGFGVQGTLTFTLKDSAGAGISGKVLTLTSAGVNLSTNSVTTGANGQASVTVTGVSDPGSVTVTSEAIGTNNSVTQDITVSSDAFTIESPAEDTEVDLGASQSVTVQLLSNSVGVDNDTITFTSTRGTLSASSAVTAGGGLATVSISSDNAGPALITATSSTGLTAQRNILFVATTADSMTLQAEPAIIGVNPVGSTASQVSTITATVRDADNNLVKNKTIDFSLSDVSGGSISPASAVTDEFGQASTVYTAGAASSAADGVSITATVTDTPSVNNTVTLTVAQEALFVTLGRGNSIIEPNTTIFQLPYTVLVTDAVGAPKADVKITLSVIPDSYLKGYYTAGADAWIKTISAGPCANEDRNQNGILDTGDLDVNLNSMLDPGNGVTLSAGIVTTDSSGFADFNVVYPQNWATWITVNLTARGEVGGSEGTRTVTELLPGLADDYTNVDADPPGVDSPFGQASACSDPS